MSKRILVDFNDFQLQQLMAIKAHEAVRTNQVHLTSSAGIRAAVLFYARVVRLGLVEQMLDLCEKREEASYNSKPPPSLDANGFTPDDYEPLP